MPEISFTNVLLWAIPLVPFAAFILIAVFSFRNRKASHTVALTGAGFSFIASMVVLWKALHIQNLAKAPLSSQVNWLPVADTWFVFGLQVDPLTVVTLAFVAVTILMIFIYSVGYHNFGSPVGEDDLPGLPPKGALINHEGHSHRVPSVEPMYSRFFAFISLFAFAMFLLVLSDNLLGLYIGWEIMGLCSYLLIGFWYGKESARKAAIKAFITTRIGDVFMLLGLAALYSLTGTLNYQQILGNPAVLNTLATTASPISGLSWAGLVGLLLFAGTIGKSAQFPLYVWLPDAMEGPTPVSAMIHAATMVSAGVYLVSRFFPLISAGDNKNKCDKHQTVHFWVARIQVAPKGDQVDIGGIKHQFNTDQGADQMFACEHAKQSDQHQGCSQNKIPAQGDHFRSSFFSAAT